MNVCVWFAGWLLVSTAFQIQFIPSLKLDLPACCSEIDRFHLFKFCFVCSGYANLRGRANLHRTLRRVIHCGRFEWNSRIRAHHRIHKVVYSRVNIVWVELAAMTTPICWVHIQTLPPLHGPFFFRKNGTTRNFRDISRVYSPQVPISVRCARTSCLTI